MIVIPVCIPSATFWSTLLTSLSTLQCDLCTASTTVSNRTTNNHRFVFHTGVVRAFERLHIADDPQVKDQEICQSATSYFFTRATSDFSMPPYTHYPYDGFVRETRSSTAASLVGFPDRQALPTPPPDEEPRPVRVSPSPGSGSAGESPNAYSISSPRVTRQSIPNLVPTFPASRSMALDHMQSSYPKVGEPLYWHHLLRHGEIPACENISEARGLPAERSTDMTREHSS